MLKPIREVPELELGTSFRSGFQMYMASAAQQLVAADRAIEYLLEVCVAFEVH